MKDKKELLTLKSYLKYHFIVLIALFSAFLILLAFLIAAIIMVEDKVFLLLIDVLLIILLGLTVAAFVVSCYRFFKLLYNDAFEVSRKNFQALVNFDKEFEYCSRNDFEEFKELNRSFKDLSKNLDGRTIISKALSFNNLGLEYVDGSDIVVTEKSLVDNITPVILASESYRNALIDISYYLGDGEISEKDDDSITKSLIKGLGYDHMLIAKKIKETGYLVYVPSFDSMSQLHEELEAVIKNISLIRRGITGRQVVPASISVVVYPYSPIDNILSDLRRAVSKREALYFYLPERGVETNQKMLISSMNINNTSRLIEEISSIDPNPDNYGKNVKAIEKTVASLANYYGFTCAGIISYDFDRDGYFSKFVHSDTDSIIFRPNARINKSFVQIINQIQDKDHSYYFSTRKHVNDTFARFIDEYRIRSGVFYVINKGEQCIGLVYFLNKSKDLAFDSYMKESLIVSCYSISTIIKEMETRKLVNVIQSRYKNMAKLSDISMYSIDKDSLELTSISEKVQAIVSTAKEGDKCYKALYGLDSPCKNCPIIKTKHMMSKINGQGYESYLILQNKDDSCAHICLQSNSGEHTKDRYDEETLLASFYSFEESLKKNLILNKNGYVIFLVVKNAKDLIAKNGNAGYVEALRQFNASIFEKNVKDTDVYLYSHDVMAIIMPDANDQDVISFSEAICDECAKVKLGSDDARLELAYIGKAYSSESAIEILNDDFEKAISKASELPGDEIYIVETDYKRSASKDGYLFELLVKAFEDKTFKVNFQPMIRNSDRLIVGAELLLRLEDKESNAKIDTGRAIAIAQARGYTSTISGAIMDYVADMIKRYGYTFFLTSGLNELAINTDTTFFNDISFMEKISSVIKDNTLPDGFLDLEIIESDVKEHYEEYKEISKKVKSVGGHLVCDQYHGDLLTPEMLKEAGFDGMKFARDVVTSLGDKSVHEKVQALCTSAKKSGLRISFVGISSRLISESIDFEGIDSFVQGNFFYNPLSEEELVESIRQRNMKDKDMDM